jgi:hypothetical protein
MKKALGWILLAFLIFYISTKPGPAAATTKDIGHGVANVAGNLGEFLTRLATNSK